jgi:hypothetical protein
MLSPSALHHPSVNVMLLSLHIQRCIHVIAASALHLQRLIFVLLQKLSISPLEAREKAKYRNAFNVTRSGRQGRQGIFELPFNAPSSAL